jgi:non-specific serine/threonine protein kinase/serine/threonine-protein kinase
MNAALWDRVRDLLHRALDVPVAERPAWVEAHAGGDAELSSEVHRLLAADDRAEGFLDVPLIADAGAAAALRDALPASRPDSLADGSDVGPYRILREIGRGGMGAVYLAVRADDVFEKTVAIKVAPGGPGRDSHRELFTRERQVLAALEYPGIARVLDGGETSTGLLYLVMEYVDGMPIDRYCDERRLDVRARLRLFVEVCAAVQYAHDHFVVHRDIKPSNVLVGPDGRVRLLDFGIAKLLARADVAPGAANQTLAHAWTPESASPEQVRGDTTSVATDVYGLGALLYRLLTGCPVFDLSAADRLERARIVCEDTPRPPSAVGVSVGVVRSQVAGDLDRVVLKALQKAPARRYRSAIQLADDVERYLAHRPVLAAPDSWRYRAGKFVGRHPAATAATAAAIVAILGASGTALWQARRADAERDRARARLADVRRLASTLIFDVYDRVENSPNATTIRRGLVEKGLAYLDDVAADARSDQALSLELAEAYRRLASVQGGGNANLGDRAGALGSLAKARALLEPFRAGADVALDVELLDLRLVRQTTSLLAREPDRRRALAAEAVERGERLADRFPARADAIEARAHAYFFAAQAAAGDEEVELWSRANRGYQALVAQKPNDPEQLRNLALTEKYLGAAYADLHRYEDARTHYERALAIDRQVQAQRPNSRQTILDVAIDLASIASLLERGEESVREAMSLFRESLVLRERAALQDPQDVFARQGIGYCLTALSNLSRRLNQIDAAVDYGRRATEMYASLPESVEVTRRGLAWLALGRAQSAASRAADGCGAYQRARTYLERAAASPPDGLGEYVAGGLRSLSETRRQCPS